MTLDINSVKIELIVEVEDEIIQHFIDKAKNIACEYTGYSILPENFNSYVIDAVVESINKRGFEGNASNSQLGNSTTFAYKDLEESLHKKLRRYKNARLLLGRKG